MLAQDKVSPRVFQRLQKAIVYIDMHIAESLSLDKIARECGVSKFHFHRLFRLCIGETVSQFILRRRLERGVSQLLYMPHLKISDIALNSGFSSSANFSKAFKLNFGITPRYVRSCKSLENSKIGKVLSGIRDYHENKSNGTFTERQKIFSDVLSGVVVNYIDQRKAVGITRHEGYRIDVMMDSREKIRNWISENEEGLGGVETYDLFHDSTMICPEDKCRFTTLVLTPMCIKVEPPFYEFDLPKGYYASFRAPFPMEESIGLAEHFFCEWLPSSGFELKSPPLIKYFSESNHREWSFMVNKR